jgi:hypothetical protein
MYYVSSVGTIYMTQTQQPLTMHLERPQKVRSRARNMVSRMSAKKARNALVAALVAFLLYIVTVAVVVVEMKSL